jgi:hypothetical protein
MPMERCIKEAVELDLREGVAEAFLRENARAILINRPGVQRHDHERERTHEV